jgi:hypothetical protein
LTARFPQPDLVLNGNDLTKKRTVRVWCAERAGLPAPPAQPDDDEFMSNRQIRQHFGGISTMTLWRWRSNGVSEGKRAIAARSQEAA